MRDIILFKLTFLFAPVGAQTIRITTFCQTDCKPFSNF